MRPWIPLLGAASSGILLGIAQVYEGTAWLCLIALVPLVFAIRDCALPAIWLRLGVFQAAHFGISMQWVRHAARWMFPLIPAWFLYCWLFLGVAALLAAVAGRGPARLLMLAPAFALSEVVQRATLFHLNGPQLGLPLAQYSRIAQLAALGGPEILTLAAVIANLALVWLLLGRRWWAAGHLALLGLAWLWCGSHLTSKPAPSTTLRAGIVQPMKPQSQEAAPSLGLQLERMQQLLDDVARSYPELIVLPESALNGLVWYHPQLKDFATGAVRRTGIPLLFGSYDRENGNIYNVAVLLMPDGRVFTYRKVRLVPVAEYTPRWIPFAAPSGWPRLTPATGYAPFPLRDGVGIGPMICLEDILPDGAREMANAGANVLAVLINTESFTGTAESLEHLRRARLTSISVGLPMLRAANSGISGALDSRGRPVDTLPEGVPTAKVVDVPLDGSPTPYRRYGDWPVIGFLSAAAVAIAAAGRKLNW